MEHKLSFAVFIFALSIVAISSVSILYPAFMVATITGSENIDPFETGVWAIPFVIVNMIILSFAILYYKNTKICVKFINFILNFEISKKYAIIIVFIIIGSYAIMSYSELSLIENQQWEDYTNRIEPVLENFPQSLGDKGLINKLIVKNFLLVVSIEIFENVKIISFLASISLLFLTYIFTAKISGKRFSGVIALVVLVQSRTFLDFDSTATYSNFWTLFYLLSLYLIYKKWYLSTPVYILSIFSKSLTIMFLPLTLFFILKAEITQRRKILTAIPYLVIIVLIIIGTMTVLIPNKYSFDSLDFWGGFAVWAFQLRYDAVLFTLILPLTVGLYLASRRGVVMADALLILITGMLLAAPLLAGFTNYTIHVYRFIPLLVFFAVGVGLLFGKRPSSNG